MWLSPHAIRCEDPSQDAVFARDQFVSDLRFLYLCAVQRAQHLAGESPVDKGVAIHVVANIA